MKNLLAAMWNLISAIFRRKKPPQAIACQFCGETGHKAEDCPNAAKYKLFHVDRE